MGCTLEFHPTPFKQWVCTYRIVKDVLVGYLTTLPVVSLYNIKWLEMDNELEVFGRKGRWSNPCAIKALVQGD
jgi:hypothetical protein